MKIYLRKFIKTIAEEWDVITLMYQHEVHKDMEFDFLKYIYLQSGISGNHYFLQFSTFATFMR